MTQDDLTVRLKGWYVGGARAVGAALEKARLQSAEAPPRTKRIQSWTWSLTHVYDVHALVALDVPWWTYDAVDAVDTWLGARGHNARVFEYGSGASSIWLARRAREVRSVEHHAEFATSMADAFATEPALHVDVVAPVATPNPEIGSRKEGYQGVDFSDYVATIDRVGGEFDLVVIDGRAREACLSRALSRLAPGGLVVFDNSRRTRYREAIAGAGVVERRYRGLTPTLPYPEQTSLLTQH